jgi:DNA-binding response OmpR family regulator
MSEAINVLLVEDEVEEKDFFIRGLEKLNLPHKVSWAKDYDELFSILEKEPDLHLVIIDLGIPGKNGKQCLLEIKAHEKYKTLPVIIMTVSKNTDDINEVYNGGAHYYAIKPYSQVNYLETLTRIFNIDWKQPQPIPEKKHFIINLAFV